MKKLKFLSFAFVAMAFLMSCEIQEKEGQNGDDDLITTPIDDELEEEFEEIEMGIEEEWNEFSQDLENVDLEFQDDGRIVATGPNGENRVFDTTIDEDQLCIYDDCYDIIKKENEHIVLFGEKEMTLHHDWFENADM